MMNYSREQLDALCQLRSEYLWIVRFDNGSWHGPRVKEGLKRHKIQYEEARKQAEKLGLDLLEFPKDITKHLQELRTKQMGVVQI